MTLEGGLLLLALVPVAFRGWFGWRLGASVEIRYALTFLLATLTAVRFWQGTTDSLAKVLIMNERILAIGVFLVIFIAVAAIGALVFGLRAPIYQSVLPNYLDQALGVLLGLFSGALVGGSLLLLAAIAAPDRFDTANFPARLDNVPRAVYQAVEKNIAGISETGLSRTLWPEIKKSEAENTAQLTWN